MPARARTRARRRWRCRELPPRISRPGPTRSFRDVRANPRVRNRVSAARAHHPKGMTPDASAPPSTRLGRSSPHPDDALARRGRNGRPYANTSSSPWRIPFRAKSLSRSRCRSAKSPCRSRRARPLSDRRTRLRRPYHRMAAVGHRRGSGRVQARERLPRDAVDAPAGARGVMHGESSATVAVLAPSGGPARRSELFVRVWHLRPQEREGRRRVRGHYGASRAPRGRARIRARLVVGSRTRV
jgi:hypothetical protein